MPHSRRLRGACEAPLFSALQLGEEPPDARSISDDGAFRLLRGWLAREAADALLAHVRQTTRWVAERRTMYDRIVDVPREQAWCGDGCERGWTRELADVRDAVECVANARFGFVLLNRYRDGNDSVAWHSDRIVADSPPPVVASLTLGATRAFNVRAKTARHRIVSVDLDHGDLVVMRPEAQLSHEHRVPKDPRIRGERINLTFRHVR